jgi:hypothetical protein
MSARSPKRQPPGTHPPADRTGVPVTTAPRGPLRWVKDLLGRSIGLEPRRKRPDAALVEPRRTAHADQPLSLLMQQRTELGARLVVHDPETQPVRHLFVVYGELRKGGWMSVEALPIKVIGRAMTEAEILADDEPSPVMTSIIDGLRELKDAAEALAAREALDREWEQRQSPEVSDTNFDEYELMERSWAGTVPGGLGLPSRTVT